MWGLKMNKKAAEHLDGDQSQHSTMCMFAPSSALKQSENIYKGNVQVDVTAIKKRRNLTSYCLSLWLINSTVKHLVTEKEADEEL